MKKIFILILYFLLSRPIYANETIHILSDSWCPYACEVNKTKNKFEGFLVEEIRKIFKKHDIEIKFEILNWSRAIRDTSNGKYDAILGAGAEDVKGFNFILPKKPLTYVVSCFYSNNPNWHFSSIDSLNTGILGVVQDYTYKDIIDKYIKLNQENKKVILHRGDVPILKMISSLTSGKINFFIEDVNVVQYYAKNWPNLNLIKKECLKKFPIYIAFSSHKNKIQSSKKLIEIFEKD